MAYDANGQLTTITQPDPDDTGPLASPVWGFSYDASHRLTQVDNPLSDSTQYAYGSHGRLTTITHPDTTTRQLTPLQTIGLPSGTNDNDLTAADPQGTSTDERGGVWKFRTDRFGNVTSTTNPLGHLFQTERDSAGLPVKRTDPDPDAAGPLTSPMTIFGYDASGNKVYAKNPDATTRTWTYTASNLAATATDELNRTASFAYDVNGNMTLRTDPAGNSITNTYTT